MEFGFCINQMAKGEVSTRMKVSRQESGPQVSTCGACVWILDRIADETDRRKGRGRKDNSVEERRLEDCSLLVKAKRPGEVDTPPKSTEKG